MKRWIALLVTAALLTVIISAYAANPIYVDGSGNGVIYSNASDANAANGDTEEEVYGDDESSSGTGYYELPTDDEDDEEVDPNAPQKWEYDPTVLTATWGNKTVTVLSLGTVVSVIKLAKLNIEVYTRELTFAADVPNEKKLAIIYAPRNAQVSMRKRPSTKSAIIMKCQTGRIVAVLGFEKNYVKVHYDDADGYVPLKCVNFVSPSDDTGVMAYVAMDGNLKSNNTVNVRQEASANARILSEFKCGQRVTVIEKGDKFTEIEAEGLRCFILTDWLVYLMEEESKGIQARGTTSVLHAGMATLSDIPSVSAKN